MSTRRLSFSMYLDNLFGTALLLGGTAIGLAAACHLVPLETGLIGVYAFGLGKLLIIGAMMRHQAEREMEAFEHGKEYARVTQLH